MKSIILSLFKPFIIAGLSLSSLALIGYFIYAAITLIWITPSIEKIEKHDAIIVLTGGPGRIENGFQLRLEDKAPKLLISGVTKGVTFKEIVDARSMPSDTKKTILKTCCISLDYEATTTEENAIESTKWIANNNVQSIILVTSASHMPRARLQFDRALKNNDIRITSYPTRLTKRSSLVMHYDFWHYTAREYFKYFGSWLRLEKINMKDT